MVAQAVVEPTAGDVQDEEILRRTHGIYRRTEPGNAGTLPAVAGTFRYSIAFFALVAFASSTHDIAADGLYIASLSSKQQAAFAGWQGGFYNVARFFAQGGLIILVGYFETRMTSLRAWGLVFTITGAILIAVSLYHMRVLPTGGEERKIRKRAQVGRDL